MPPHLPPVPSVGHPAPAAAGTSSFRARLRPLLLRAHSQPRDLPACRQPAPFQRAATPPSSGARPTPPPPPGAPSPPPPSGARLSVSFRARWIWTSAPAVGRRRSIHQPEPVQMPDLKFERLLMVIHRRDAWRTSPSTCRFSTGQGSCP